MESKLQFLRLKVSYYIHCSKCLNLSKRTNSQHKCLSFNDRGPTSLDDNSNKYSFRSFAANFATRHDLVNF